MTKFTVTITAEATDLSSLLSAIAPYGKVSGIQEKPTAAPLPISSPDEMTLSERSGMFEPIMTSTEPTKRYRIDDIRFILGAAGFAHGSASCIMHQLCADGFFRRLHRGHYLRIK